MTHILVIGGGISGLAAAWEVVSRGASVTLVEGSDRLGGKIATESFAGVDLDTGPDSFLARVPAATQLATEVGLGGSLVAPGTGQAWMWARGRLRSIPVGTVLGVPTRPGVLARSDVLPRRAAARAALDLVLPGAAIDDADVSVGALVRPRMGRDVQMGLVDPLVGGINAGHSDALSAAVVAPQLLAAAQRGPSLMRGLRVPSPAGGPVFLTVAGGMARLVDAIADRLGPAVTTGDRVVGLATDGRTADGRTGWAARLASGRVVTADGVVIACPPSAAASLLQPVSEVSAAGLRLVRMSSVVLTTLAYGYVPLTGSGFLVPRREGRLLTACTWMSTKWPHLATPGQIILRASAGRIDDDRAMGMDDASIVSAIHAELSLAIGLRTPPLEATVHRWPDAFPQYEVGHLDRMATVSAGLPAGITLAGAALRGVGLATCIAGGREAAAKLLAPCD
ncbi:MAG: protoporphyrinogen oxidase [Acidimicrobiales bacterium]